MANITMAAIQDVNITADSIATTITQFSYQDFLAGIKPLLLFIVGMTIYAIFVFKFYRFLSRRDILKLKTKEYYQAYEGFLKHTFRSIFYVLENLILIPILIFFWFAVLAILMLVISKSPSLEQILLTSAAIVAAVRVTSYYNEALSQDLAKMIPFALLGVFLVDSTYLRIDQTIAAAKQVPHLMQFMLYYLLFVTLLEFVLRIVHGIAGLVVKKELKHELEET